MRKQILLAFLLALNLLAKGQDIPTFIDTVFPPNPRLVDDAPLGLGVHIGDNQNYLKGKDPDLLIAQPTVIETKKINDVFYVKAYVNNDYFSIIAPGIASSNWNNYKAFQQVSWSKIIPQPDDKTDIEMSFSTGNVGKDITFLNTSDINSEKIDGRNYLFFIKDVKSGQIVSKLALDFVYPRPEPKFLSIDKNLMDHYNSRPSETINFSPGVIDQIKKHINEINLVPSKFNTQTNLPEQLVLPYKDNSLLLQFKTLRIGAINHLEYKFDNDSNWKTSVKNEYPFIILRNIQAGKHKLLVRYPGEDSAIFEYAFEIKPAWYQTTTFKIILGSFLTAFILGGIFTFKYKRQQHKLKAENVKRKQVETQISALRAQLNPHFVFNALNSIQGLVNKNDQEGANLYISKFGALMRDILEQSNKTFHPLALEIKQLESYLQLEQLRFKFQYQVLTDKSINTATTVFPVMLLQPFAENAIKHGIAAKKEKGCLHIYFEKSEDNLMVLIHDNGDGFSPAEPTTGYGIKLIKERIEALNELSKDQPISYKIHSTPTEGTKVTLTFTNWL
jgi:hypothetical protein